MFHWLLDLQHFEFLFWFRMMLGKFPILCSCVIWEHNRAEGLLSLGTFEAASLELVSGKQLSVFRSNRILGCNFHCQLAEGLTKLHPSITRCSDSTAMCVV